MKKLLKKYIIDFFVLLNIICTSACDGLQTQTPSGAPENKTDGLTFIT